MLPNSFSGANLFAEAPVIGADTIARLRFVPKDQQVDELESPGQTISPSATGLTFDSVSQNPIISTLWFLYSPIFPLHVRLIISHRTTNLLTSQIQNLGSRTALKHKTAHR
jgi:hypothetical protein